MENNEENIRESPATHSKKAQLIVLSVMGVLLALIIVNAIFKTSRNIGGDADQSVRTETLESAAERAERFKRQLALARSSSEPEPEPKSSYQEIVEKYADKPGPDLTLPPPVVEEVDPWIEKEMDRIRSSRYDDYSLNLNLGTTPPPRSAVQRSGAAPGPRYSVGAPSPQVSPRAKPPASRALAGIAGIGDLTLPNGLKIPTSRSSLAEKRNYIDARLAKAAEMLQKIEDGKIDEVVAERSGRRPAAPPARRGLGLTSNRAKVGRGGVAGQAASTLPNNQPKPGQELLPVGSVIRAAIDQKVMSDYPGPFRLRITQDVYDVTNKHVLIPKGSIASCRSLKVSNVNEPIQARMGYIVKYVVLPDGKKIDFSRQAGLDREGVAGVKDKVNRHFMAQFLGVVAYAMVSDRTSRDTAGSARQGTYAGDVGSGVSKIGSQLAQKYLSLVPTITWHPGINVRIFIEEEVFIFPWETISDRYVN